MIDICIDSLPFGVTAPSVSYGSASSSLFAVAGGISHTVAVYPFSGASQAGLECPTAPGPYITKALISVTTISPGVGSNPLRETIVLGGRAATGTLGLYVSGEPSFTTMPPTEAISHNAAPAFSIGKANGVGFGYTPSSGVPTTLPGAGNVPAPAASIVGAAVINTSVISPIAAIPAAFYDGIGVASGTVVPITTVPAPAAIAGQPYVVQLYAIDGAGGTLFGRRTGGHGRIRVLARH